MAMMKNAAPPEVDDDDEAPEPMDDFDDDEDNPDEETEQFALPKALLEAAGILTDEDWDALPAAQPPKRK